MEPHKSERRRGRPSADEIEAIDAQVLAAGFAAFKAVGFDAAQMETIAADAGISKATLYRRFPNKAALLAAVVASLSGELAAAVASVDSGGDALTRLRALMRVYRRRAGHPDQIALQRFTMAVLPFEPSVLAALDTVRAHYVAPVDALVDEAVRDGTLARFPTERIRETMFDLLVNGVASLALVGGAADVDEDAAFDFAWNTLTRGLLARSWQPPS